MEENLYSNASGLDAVIDDYTEWFTHVVRRISYPKVKQDKRQYATPESFQIWVAEARKAELESELINGLAALHSDLVNQADKVVDKTLKAKKAPEFKDFDAFMTLFEEFIRNIRRMEIDFLLQESAIEPVTGFRNVKLLNEDLGCEMDRLSRQGKPFSLALVRIDNFEEMKKTSDISEVIKLVAKMIHKSLRSFDDAYRISEGEFVLSLKQADIEGGLSALERLKQELQIYESENGGSSGLSLSSCVSEPVPGDDVNELVDNLIIDLNSCDNLNDGSVLEHHERSPLQRFVDGGQE